MARRDYEAAIGPQLAEPRDGIERAGQRKTDDDNALGLEDPSKELLIVARVEHPG
jgi:hypothetical protein